jgi:hypothetical protein
MTCLNDWLFTASIKLHWCSSLNNRALINKASWSTLSLTLLSFTYYNMQDVKSPAYQDEKIEYDLHSVDNQVIVEDDSSRHAPIEEYQFTWRATIVGSLLGCLVGNIHHKSALLLL